MLDIQGLDLKIDNSIQEICETSNSSSSTTRSVLYVLVIVNVMALVSVLNSHKYNWSYNRIEGLKDSISFYKKDTAIELAEKKEKSILKLLILTKQLENTIRSDIDNFQTVRIPLFGNTFDVNNLGVVSGITFCILLVFLRFTLAREINNLKIALSSISERYIETANKEDFIVLLDLMYANNQTNALKAINFTRRQHHYHYLSMNEIFNLPPLKYSVFDYSSNTHKVLMKIFWFPFVIYVIILLNDLITINYGLAVSPIHTGICFGLSIVFLFLIMVLSKSCTKQKEVIFDLYKDFKDNDYKYTNTKF